jgi:hypothetical protein
MRKISQYIFIYLFCVCIYIKKQLAYTSRDFDLICLYLDYQHPYIIKGITKKVKALGSDL